jgi:hypothetical protein
MRESVFLEMRLHRFDVWRVAIGVVTVVTLAALGGWTLAMVRASDGNGVAWVASATAVLAVATVAIARSLMRVAGGVLACSDGAWSFTTDSGALRPGTLEVAIDLGSFLLLRLPGGRGRVWLPVQRLGLEREWHALRCAVYSPPAAAAASPIVPHPTP